MNPSINIKILKKLLLIIAITAFPQLSFPQSGLPFVKNFTAKEYKAHTQNFSIVQDNRGLIYVGNFAGILEYDGISWHLITTLKTTKVSSLAINDKGRIFVGARGEIGFLSPDSSGLLKFRSLNYKIDKSKLDFLDVVSICTAKEGTYFISEKYIFLWDEKDMKNIELKNEVLSAFYVNDKLFIHQKNLGLTILKNGKAGKLTGGEVFTNASEIKAMLPYNNQIKLITQNQGLFIIDDKNVQKFETEIDADLIESKLSCAQILPDGSLALGTNRNGLIILTSDGKFKLKLDKSSGIQDENINNLFLDNNSGLWLALNNGISFVEAASPLSYYDEKSGIKGEITKILRFNDKLYASTYQGLFYLDNSMNSFIPVEGIKTACWDVIVAENALFAATSEGVFIVDDNSVTQLNDVFSLSLFYTNENTKQLFIGYENGLKALTFENNKWNDSDIKTKINGEVWNIAGNKQAGLWLETSSNGIFYFDFNSKTTVHYDTSNGLPSMLSNHINILKNDIVFSTKEGLYNFDSKSKSFKLSSLLDNDSVKFSKWIYALIEDNEGNLWTTAGNETNITQYLKKNNYEENSTPFLPISDFIVRTIYFDEDGISWLGGPDGIISYDSKVKFNYDAEFNALLRKVGITGDSVIFNGTFFNNEQISALTQNNIFKYTLNFQNNTINFQFGSSSYNAKRQALFQYKLEDFDKTWSDWSTSSFKEYTNLQKGNYIFKLRAKNIYDKTSTETTYEFRIRPAMYNTILAYFIYVILAGIIVFLIVRQRSLKLIKEKHILEETITQRTAEIVHQKEEIEQQSEELADRNEELNRINEVVKSINSEIHFANLLQTILDKLKNIKGVEKATALLLDKETNKFKFRASHGWDLDNIKDVQLDLNQAVKRYLKNSEEIYEDIFIKSDFKLNQEVNDLDILENPKSMLILVIKVDSNIEGFLIFENMLKDNAFNNQDLNFIKNSKEHIISAFIKTKILEDLQKTLDNLKDTQAQLVQSEKLASLGQMTAGIAHEIKNPLNFINNFSSLCVELSEEVREILDDFKDKISEDEYDEIDEVIGMIESNAKKINEHGGRADRIVKGMLQHSRGDSGEFQLTDINNMVEEYMNLAFHGVRAENKEFNTALNKELDPTLEKIMVAPQDLSRVILNIVNNACYAVDEKAKKFKEGYSPAILASTKKDGKNVIIIIKDNGTGMPQHVIDKIFNPFFTTKPTGKGTGLGLSMSFDIITQIHKGKMEVTSKDGEYTEFKMIIPMNL